jgi:hypothetical protein
LKAARYFLTFSAVLVACRALLVLCGLHPVLAAQQAGEPVIPAYCSQAATKDAQLFAAVPNNTNPAQDHWHKISQAGLQSADRNGNSTASVSMHRGKVAEVNATFQNQFGDSTLHVAYCYRADGTLARLHSDLKSYHGGMEVVRTMSFDEAGQRRSNEMQSFDLQTGQPKKLPADFWDFPPPIFLHASDLPFAKEIQD